MNCIDPPSEAEFDEALKLLEKVFTIISDRVPAKTMDYYLQLERQLWLDSSNAKARHL